MRDINEELGRLAFEFRGTRDVVKRKEIADKYALEVINLIDSNVWDEAPGPEDMLPHDWMPKAFFDYWRM